MDWFMGSQICHWLAYLLTSWRGELEWEDILVNYVVYASEAKINDPGLKALNACIRKFEREGFIVQKKDKSPSLTLCEEKAKKDKRVKNPIKYCLKRGEGTIVNKIIVDKKLINAFCSHLSAYSVNPPCPLSR